MIRGIIFDMDGVVIDSEHLWVEAIRQQMAKRSLVIPRTAAYQRYVNLHFRGRNQRHAILMWKRYFHLAEPANELIRERVTLLLNIFKQKLRPIPGIRGLLNKTHPRYPLALASSSPRSVIRYALRRVHLRSYFQSVISGDDFHHSKPNPEIFLTAARQLRLPARDCLVIEDSLSGVLAAHRARMRCIGLKQPYNTRRDLQTADIVVQRLSQITLPLIRSL